MSQAHTRLAAVLGASPFPWQSALLDRFLAGQIPGALDIPTGLGKTAVMAIWLVARAEGAAVPRRLVYVVDRRAVIDQATSVAEKLRAMVDSDSELKRALLLDGPLPISTLRGQFVDNRQWLADPSTPAIVLGTVDMVGSRILFEGYGVSRRMRPYHAGLLGVDTLIVLDEAHLVPPFERLVEAIERGARTIEGISAFGSLVPRLETVVAPLRLLSLSATGRERGDAHTLGQVDHDDPVVTRRLTAVKRLVMREEAAERDIAERLASEAWALSESGTKALRCIVFCNRRDVAQAVKTALEIRSKTAVVELFVGARRVFERQAAARWLEDRGFIAGSDGAPSGPTFLIATSAGEVGVDLDADHMVSDLVPWERMVQRLGRVNRRGNGAAQVIVVPVAADEEADGERLDAVRALLRKLPASDGSTDVSLGAIADLRAKARGDSALAELLALATTPAPLHPPLTRPLLEAWSMTSLEEHTGRPEVEPWIRGWPDEEPTPQTTVVWREFLPLRENDALLGAAALETFLDAAGPHLAEMLETETWRVIDWLEARLKRAALLPATPTGDSDSDPNRERLGLTKQRPLGIVLDGRRAKVEALRFSDVSKERRKALHRKLAGATLVIDARIGGLSGGLLDHVSDQAFDVTTLSLDGSSAREDGAGVARVLPFRIRLAAVTANGETLPAGYAPLRWRLEARIAVSEDDGEETTWLAIETLASADAESEDGRSVGPRRAQELDEHQVLAEQVARRIAGRLAMPEPYASMLALAARLHDEGKRAKHWQRAFNAPRDGKVYAKTRSRPNFALLNGFRHELGSLPRAEADPRVIALDDELRDLFLHLIAAHHGFGRPILRIEGAEEPPSLLVDRAREVALRFSRLEKQWGPWGLAWWETLLRAADQQASRVNDEGGARG